MIQIQKPVGTKDATLGTVAIPQFEAVDEALELYDLQIVLHLLNKATSTELERVARDNFKKLDSTPESVQAIVDAYRPGMRITKPSLKNFTMLAQEFVEAGDVASLQTAYKLNQDEDVEAAFNYLNDLKLNGALR